jgi:hypothetical protein
VLPHQHGTTRGSVNVNSSELWPVNSSETNLLWAVFDVFLGTLVLHMMGRECQIPCGNDTLRHRGKEGGGAPAQGERQDSQKGFHNDDENVEVRSYSYRCILMPIHTFLFLRKEIKGRGGG